MPELTELLAQLLFVLLPLVTIKAFKPVAAFTPLNSRAVPQGRGSELKGGPCLVPFFASLTQWAATGNVYLASVQRMGKRIGLLFCKPTTSRTPDGKMVLDSKMLLAGLGTSGQFAFHENVQHALNNVYPYFNDTADVDAKGELIPSRSTQYIFRDFSILMNWYRIQVNKNIHQNSGRFTALHLRMEVVLYVSQVSAALTI